ncbi:MAG: flavodoxin domain-containing protein [Cellulosilyticaceae bacterium]
MSGELGLEYDEINSDWGKPDECVACMKTLIVYSSVYGFTESCAKRLAANIAQGADLICLGPLNMPNITAYDQIIIGTPIYLGQINMWIKIFCENKLEQLMRKQVGVFVCCGLLDEVDEVIGTSFPKQLIIAAKSIEVLGGEVDYDKLRIYHKAVVRVMAVTEPGFLYQNHRRLVRSLNG